MLVFLKPFLTTLYIKILKAFTLEIQKIDTFTMVTDYINKFKKSNLKNNKCYMIVKAINTIKEIKKSNR